MCVCVCIEQFGTANCDGNIYINKLQDKTATKRKLEFLNLNFEQLGRVRDVEYKTNGVPKHKQSHLLFHLKKKKLN